MGKKNLSIIYLDSVQRGFKHIANGNSQRKRFSLVRCCTVEWPCNAPQKQKKKLMLTKLMDTRRLNLNHKIRMDKPILEQTSNDNNKKRINYQTYRHNRPCMRPQAQQCKLSRQAYNTALSQYSHQNTFQWRGRELLSLQNSMKMANTFQRIKQELCAAELNVELRGYRRVARGLRVDIRNGVKAYEYIQLTISVHFLRVGSH